MKQLLQWEQKQADVSLAKLYILVLDTVAPLIHIVEEAGRATLTGEVAVDAAKVALLLLGNASAQVSKERWKRAIMYLNKKVQPLAEEEDIFEDAEDLNGIDCPSVEEPAMVSNSVGGSSGFFDHPLSEEGPGHSNTLSVP